MSQLPEPEQKPDQVNSYIRRRGRPAPTDEQLQAAEQERQAQAKAAAAREGVDAGAGRLDDAPVPESFDAAIRGAIEDRRQRRHGL